MPYAVGDVVRILSGGYETPGLRNGDLARIRRLYSDGCACLQGLEGTLAIRHYNSGMFFTHREFGEVEGILEETKEQQMFEKGTLLRLNKEDDRVKGWCSLGMNLNGIFVIRSTDYNYSKTSVTYRLQEVGTSNAYWVDTLPDRMWETIFFPLGADEVAQYVPTFSVGDYYYDSSHARVSRVVSVYSHDGSMDVVKLTIEGQETGWSDNVSAYSGTKVDNTFFAGWKALRDACQAKTVVYFKHKETQKDYLLHYWNDDSCYLIGQDIDSEWQHYYLDSNLLFARFDPVFEDKAFENPALANWGVTYKDFNTSRTLFDKDKPAGDASRFYQSMFTKDDQFSGIVTRLFTPKVSQKVVGNIALYQNKAQLDKGVPLTLRIGRGLRLMKPNLNDKELEVLVDKFRVTFPVYSYTLKVSDQAADFKRAYAHDMSPTENIYTTSSRKSLANSCMRGDRYSRMATHPAEVYASGDFKIYWTELPDGRIGSRCVVYHPEDGVPQAGPIYGTTEASMDMIAEALLEQDAKMNESSSWDGARMKYVVERGDVVGPYLDKSGYCDVEGDYLVITSCGGAFEACSYGGYLQGYSRYFCNDCDDAIDEDDACHYDDGTCYCSSCYSERFVRCEHSHSDILRDESAIVFTMTSTWSGVMRETGVVVHQDYTENGTYVYCEARGEHWLADYTVTLHDGTYEHQDDAMLCAETDEWYLGSDVGECSDGCFRNTNFLHENGWVVNPDNYTYYLPEVEEESEAA